ncbi:MAG: hypothetical protein M3N19_09905 [Candidatus Eremiobacteraeota bacterium]|nr:hypothetical protein [Candidatus Eremiobacteraeota bacterium]
MKIFSMRAAALALICLWLVPGTSFSAQPINHSKPRPLPTPRLPNVPLHTEFVVQVNHMGQIVRVRSGKECSYPSFNAQTYGNVLQMFVRHPDGTATVGLYRVKYDYNPQTKSVHRGVELLSAGGDWGDEQGAANQMMELDRKNRAKHLALPGFDKMRQPTPSPKPH